MRKHRFLSAALLVLALVLASPAVAQQRGAPGAPSLDSLLNIRISSAARYEQLGREAPASITVLTRDDLEQFGFTYVAQVLETLRGFYGTYDRNHSNIGMRGISRPSDTNKRMLLLVDGTPWNDVGNDQATVGTGLGIPIEMVERIEVVRGPGSALYGTSAMLAVVNLVTREGRSLQGVRSVAETGSFGLKMLRTWAGSLLSDGTDLTAHATWSDTEGPDLYFPEFIGSSGRGHVSGRNGERNVSWGLRAKKEWLTAVVQGVDTYGGDPTAPLGSSVDTDGTYRDTQRISGVLRMERSLSPRFHVRGEVFVHRSSVALGFAFDEPLPDRVLGMAGTKWGGEAQIRFDTGPSNRLVVGLVHHGHTPNVYVTSAGQRGLDARPRVNLASIFVQEEWEAFPGLSITAGVRADQYTDAGSAVSPRASAVYHPSSSSSLKLLYGSAFRAPTLIEQFIDEPGVGKANLALDPERIRQMEMVWEQRIGGQFQLAASAFEYRMKDLIGLVVDPSDGLFQYRNVDRARSKGVSAEVVGRLSSGTSLFVNGSWQRAENEATSKRLPNSPEYLVRVGASTRIPGGFRVGAMALADGNRNSVYGTPTGSFAIVNVNLIAPDVNGFTASVSVRNALDASYIHPGGTEHRQVGIPQDGRTVRVTVSAAF